MTVPLLSSNTEAQNSAILQSAIDAAPMAVELPAGSFSLDPVTLRPGVAVLGRSPLATRLRPGANGQTVFSYMAGASLAELFEVSGISFDAVGLSGVTGIKIDGNTQSARASRLRVLDLEFWGSFAVAVHLRYTANSTIDRVCATHCTTGILLENAGDTDVSNVRVQLGSGIGYKIIGGSGAYDEGIRLIGCSTNGQAKGIDIAGQEWGLAAGCSFTTCEQGALTASGSSNWSFSACDFSVAGYPALYNRPNIELGADCSSFSIEGCNINLGTFGAILRGWGHTLSSNKFKANSNVDIYLDRCSKSVITGNTCDSTGVPWSIYEYQSSQNAVVGNICNGAVQVSGGAYGNVIY